MAATLQDRNRRAALMALVAALGMLALGYASVPLYRMFCQVTGWGGTTMRVDPAVVAERAHPVAGNVLSIRFDANTSPALPWSFHPEQNRDRVTVGARDMQVFIAENKGTVPVTGTATFNVTPSQAGKYFTKIQCFCFTEQRLEPGQRVRMPVLYYVDPAILEDPDARDIQEITLSYTFFPVDRAGTGG
ncbi:cytochrome c oxidase assembly protein subunit 11 [Sphingomonas jejuensis]|uniref:Cytochrome c oxidase assembly protein CtaG n=1 Tax=Sphingomonas jejuensis TaxID=904715 RepID=A0ABX0XPY9_9SPHN|nr:cytochrome c oxidase assembly protein [Sphingomonas jejuensis]NJC34854.1 cytochrome c oxidase assembly protein subunit 11 [Sphingomonas jejuensis]